MPLSTKGKYSVSLDVNTLFLLSTSGSQSSIVRHNQALQAMGLNIVYFTFGRAISAETYANMFKSPIIRGGAVTGQGLKSGIIPFLHVVEPLAKRTNAVNTVVNREGKLFGYNTDAFGFESALRRHIKKSRLKIKKAVMYGSGGVSGVAAFVLKNMGMTVTMAGRNPKKVTAKMKELKLRPLEGPFDLVVNATPISSKPLNQAQGFLNLLRDCKMVFDHSMPEWDGKINYVAKHCAKFRIHFVPGTDMYRVQMAKQWGLFLNGLKDERGKPFRITEQDVKRYWKLKSSSFRPTKKFNNIT